MIVWVDLDLLNDRSLAKVSRIIDGFITDLA